MIEVVVAIGVEEAEAGEVPLLAELLWSGGEEEDGGGVCGEGVDEFVSFAGVFRRPIEVVGFIDNEKIPVGFEGLGDSLGVGEEEVGGAEDELVFEEGIEFGILRGDGLASFFIEDGEGEIEAAVKLDKPLMDEGVGEEDEDAVGATGEVEAVEDEAGLDGFSEADFVSEEGAGVRTGGDFVGDVNLVGDEVDAPTEETTDG